MSSGMDIHWEGSCTVVKKMPVDLSYKKTSEMFDRNDQSCERGSVTCLVRHFFRADVEKPLAHSSVCLVTIVAIWKPRTYLNFFYYFNHVVTLTRSGKILTVLEVGEVEVKL